MNLKSDIWVGAHLRRWQAAGLYATVIAKGSAEAGAIFVIVNHLDGHLHLFGPAPGPAYDDDGARRFIEEIAFPATQELIDRLLARRRAADPDIWIVEVEDRRGSAGLSAVKDEP